MISNVMPTYSRIDVTFERGKGAYLFDSEGRQYLDFASGIAVNALGHCHPHLVEAVQEQASKLWHTSNLYHIPGQQKLADRLVAATFADSVFFANSGAEAVECSLKMSRKYQSDHGQPERYRVITCINAFHGRTLATIAAGGQGKHLTGFSPSVDGFDQVPFGDLNEIRAAIGPETAAIMVEPVQGEGGINVAQPAYLKGLREAADEFNLLLIFDEVQCGMGRTGKLFAHEWAGVIPDIMAVAKGIGGGFPVAACLASESAALALSAGSHGSTFGGNPMAMAAANAVCDVIMGPGFLDGVDKVAKNLRARLDALAEEYPGIVKGIRGSGLMIGIDCVGNSVDFRAKLHEGGLLSVGAAGNVIRLLPPLIIEQNHIDEAIEILSTVCARIKTDG